MRGFTVQSMIRVVLGCLYLVQTLLPQSTPLSDFVFSLDKAVALIIGNF